MAARSTAEKNRDTRAAFKNDTDKEDKNHSGLKSTMGAARGGEISY
jgi:hypothetical protein